METTFTDLVDKILELPIDEKEEIKNIIDHFSWAISRVYEKKEGLFILIATNIA
jgi:hypothetical protein